jgi:uncharacterized repeat protein (TIGR01451 family)
VGASTSSDGIASFSSRGPVTVDGSRRLKPDVTAPGVGVRSSIPGERYGFKSGTSMAGPHVAGTVALLWSAAPGLVGDVDGTEWLIAQTARPRVNSSCGGEPDGHPNNVYGWGIVDALAAVQRARSEPQISKQAAFAGPAGFSDQLLVYTLRVTNTAYLTLTEGVLTDTVPANTTFAWASGDYAQADDVITWTAATLESQESLAVTLAVTVEHLPPGTRVVNAAYGVRAREWITPVVGTPVDTVIPWRYFLWPVLGNWSPGGVEGNDDG